MNIKEKINLASKIYYNRFERYLMQCPNAEQEQKLDEANRMHLYTASAVASLADVESYLDLRLQQIEETDFNGNENAWIEEIRRYSAIVDLLLFNKCTYDKNCKIEPVSFKNKTLKKFIPDERPSDEINKKLLPV